jgi:Tol biopolymer transport system component
LIGRVLSHYRVTAALGAGGMGEVYRATDTNLHREVAIKVLPPEVVLDPVRLSRFRREAQLLAALNHPNIAAIYGLEEADGQPFLALELVEGEDLSERLARGAIPVDEALEIAEQVAEALEEAHGKGIVHRDLKPANVKLTADGKVKVLDFGLAKACAADAPAVDSRSQLSRSPTLAHTGTIAGVILGTAAYMSPEQARGKPVDKRADVWSFGVVVWEMLTGRSLFAGDTVTDVIAAVVTREPDFDALPQATPRAVRRLLGRCLRKDARTRLPDIGAARLELQDLVTGAASEVEAPSGAIEEITRAHRRSRKRERLAWGAVALAAAGFAAASAYLYLRRVPVSRPAVRFVVDAPEGWMFLPAFGWPVPSPDGRQIVFLAVRTEVANAPPMLWTRSLDSLTPRLLAGTEGAEIPMWSPDGRFLAFAVGAELRKLSLSGGTVQRICGLPSQGAGGDWREDGTILFSSGGGTGRLFTVTAAGGKPQSVLVPDAARGERGFVSPRFLPDGRRFLFVALGQGEGLPGVYVASLERPAERHLLLAGMTRVVSTPRHVLFVRDGTLLAQPFDVGRAALRGEPVPVASAVGFWSSNPGIGWFAASTTGTLAYISGQETTGQLQLAWVDRKGGRVEAVGAPGNYGQIALSPDERNVAVEIADTEGHYDLWVMDVARGVTSRVTATPGDERDPVWSPDGRSLAFVARRDGVIEIRRKGLRASDPETVLTHSSHDDIPESWSRDGRTLLFVRRIPGASENDDKQSGWALSLQRGGEPELVVKSLRADELQISPDGRWLSSVSRESGRDEVYLEPFHREGDRVRVSVNGGGQPKWRADGRELFYTTPANRLVAVAVRAHGDRLDVSLPSDLFEIRGLQGTGYDDYAPAADGQRFLVKLRVEKDRKPQLHVVTNWTSLLESSSVP